MPPCDGFESGVGSGLYPREEELLTKGDDSGGQETEKRAKLIKVTILA